MASRKTDRPTITTFADYEVITPPNKLQGAVADAIDGDDPIARAEAALAALSSEFSGWMDDECDQLDLTRRNIRQAGMGGQQLDELFRAAHDIRGQAATLGFPLVAAIAESLCRLLEHTHDPQRIPLPLIDQHVDAVRAIIREHARPQAEAIAEQLTRRLSEVTEEFLRHEGKDPDAADGIASPPIAPQR
jgi:chemotaxis protein histidine kinase CheA